MSFVGRAIRWNKLGLRLSRLMSIIRKESRMHPDYSWTKGILKALAVFGLVGLGAIASALADPEQAKQLLEGTFSPNVVTALVMVLSAIAKWWLNMRKVNKQLNDADRAKNMRYVR